MEAFLGFCVAIIRYEYEKDSMNIRCDLQKVYTEYNEFCSLQNEGNIIAHYTKVETIEKIASGFKDAYKSDYILLWAVDAFNTNDKEEIIRGYNFVMNLFEMWEENIPDRYKISKWSSDLPKSTKYKDHSSESIRDWFYKDLRRPYVICFSRIIDEISMWNTSYGNEGKGVCLLFDFSTMNYSASSILINSPLPVVYENKLGYLPIKNLFSDLISSEYLQYMSEVCSLNTIDEIIEKKLMTIELVCAFISSYIKTEDWYYEQEVRLMCTTNNESVVVQYPKPHIEVPIPLKCLKQIIIGPCASVEQIEKVKEFADILKIPPENVIISNKPLRC